MIICSICIIIKHEMLFIYFPNCQTELTKSGCMLDQSLQVAVHKATPKKCPMPCEPETPEAWVRSHHGRRGAYHNTSQTIARWPDRSQGAFIFATLKMIHRTQIPDGSVLQTSSFAIGEEPWTKLLEHIYFRGVKQCPEREKNRTPPCKGWLEGWLQWQGSTLGHASM